MRASVALLSTDALLLAARAYLRKEYNEDQARDERGRWATVGAGSSDDGTSVPIASGKTGFNPNRDFVEHTTVDQPGHTPTKVDPATLRAVQAIPPGKPNSKEAQAWVQANAALYQTNRDFKTTVDAIMRYTDGDHEDIRDATKEAVGAPGTYREQMKIGGWVNTPYNEAKTFAASNQDRPLAGPLWHVPALVVFPGQDIGNERGIDAYYQGIKDERERLIAAGVPAKAAHEQATETVEQKGGILPPPGDPGLFAAGKVLASVLANADPYPAPIYRGVIRQEEYVLDEAGHILDDKGKIATNEYEYARQLPALPKVGEIVDLKGATSFASDPEVAVRFATSGDKGSAGSTPEHGVDWERVREHQWGDTTSVVYEVQPGAAAINVGPLTTWNQAEVITAGRFQVVSVAHEEEVPVKNERGRVMAAVKLDRVVLKQIGVWRVK